MKAEEPRQTPPRWATRLLAWYCAPHLLEEVQGDLEEEFQYQVAHNGMACARLDYVRSVLGFLKPFAIKRKSSFPSTPSINMNLLKHYVIVAFRNIIHQKSFSLINISGLALGMTCCLFIFLWVRDEQRVDNFHANGKNLYASYQTITSNSEVSGTYITPIRYLDNTTFFLLSDIKFTVPEVKYSTMYVTGYELPWGHPETFQVGERLYKLEGSRAGEDFFKMFSYQLLAGDAESALHDISSLAISRHMAELFFDSPANAIGKSIRCENKSDFTITAVFENLPAESTLKFDYLVNWNAYMQGKVEAASGNIRTFIQLQDNANPRETEVKINRYLASRYPKEPNFNSSIGLQPYGEQYLHDRFENGKPGGGRIEYVHIFSGVAIFILLIACINFMNLATARSVKRAKEVGVRKVIGSSRAHLIGQFFGESILLSLLALLISVLLLQLLLPGFNNFTGKQIASPIGNPSAWLALTGLMLMTGIIAGSYPALFLSSLKPVRILKGTLRFTKSAVWFRKGLAGFQFTLSIVLLIATIVVSRQTSYVQNTNLGYDRENLLYIRIEGQMNPKYAVFKEQAMKMPGIAMVDRSSEAPHAMGFVVDSNDGSAETLNGNDAINWEGKERSPAVGFKPTSVGFDFVKLMKLKMAAGRDFSKTFATDSADAFIVNEEAVKQMEMKDPIGKWVSAWKKKGHIIGVLKDYHTHSLHEPIKPVIIDVKEYEYFGVILVRTEPGKTKEALASLETLYKETNPNYPFVYQFADQEYEKLYRNEQVMTKLTNAFAAIAISISCLGLLGLVMFASEQRVKEFGIRKVLGASVSTIVNLLAKDFLLLVSISFIIAAPIAGYFMYQWLQGFAFKITLSWWIFATAGGAALLVALLTISIQAIKSAIANPIQSLRSE